MKKLFLFVLFFVFAIYASYGQKDVSETGHLRFMGIEMTGSISDFIGKLEDKGMTVYSQDNSNAVLLGRFAGKDAMIDVFTTPKSNMVHGIEVIFNNTKNDWSYLKSQYLNIKEMLSNKYGKPVEMEYFEKPDTEGSGNELYELKEGKGAYQSTFLPEGLLDEGMIVLSIKASYTNPYVGLNYVDGKNSKLYMSESLEDL